MIGTSLTKTIQTWTLPALALWALLALLAGPAEATSRSSCAGLHSYPCEGNAEPTCGSSSGCDGNNLVWDILNYTVDSPWPIPDETVTHGCNDPTDAPNCSCRGAMANTSASARPVAPTDAIRG